MSDPTRRNRLGEEQSPYLRQHADNPVNWQPWDDAAREAARERDVPIFLSIGYSACHWCHVMEEESFQDEAVAELLNEHFVPVKVDREERPDVDSVYMTICQLVTGGGGWPLSAWLTPDGRPFYVGTYFPPESRGNTPGFSELLENLARSWETDREEIENRADQWAAALRDELETTPEQPGDVGESDLLGDAVGAALRSADREHGGFGRGGPKFPHPGRIHLLLRAFARSGREEALRVATETLDAMADGGMYDHLGGGFHRYATDRDWTVPHFEKMLYDNAELPRAYLAGYQVTGDERYADVVRDTLAFIDRELAHDDGGFFSTLDARSVPPPVESDEVDPEAEEGAFYVWTPDQVHAELDETTAELFCDRYGVTSAGNFEGATVLTRAESIPELAEEYGSDEATVESRLIDAEVTLRRAREERPRPARDEKVLAGWNGLAISAFAEAGRVLEPPYLDRAEEALGFVRDRLWDADAARLSRRFKDGDVAVDGYLEDYAFLGRGALDCYGASGDVDHLAFAVDLADAVVEEFWDPEAGTLYFTPGSGESLVTRPQELTDRSTPSSVGVAVNLLLDLDHFVPDREFGDVAERVLDTHADRVRGSPLEHVSLAMAADTLANGAVEVTVAAPDADLPDEWRDALADRYLPGLLLAPRPPVDELLAPWLDAIGAMEIPPIWANREARDDRPTIYACRNFSCSPPEHDVEAALDWLAGADGDADGDGDE